MSVNIKLPPTDYQHIQMGQRGADWFDNTSVRTGDWSIITALTDVVFTTLTSDDNTPFGLNGTAPGVFSAKTLPKGATMFGRFTTITLTSGTLIAYRT